MAKIIKKGNLYFPGKEIKKNSWVNDKTIYQKAARQPVKFWEELAGGLFWRKKWQKGFEHRPPFFKWFLGGRINIVENCLDRHLPEQKNKPALVWVPEPINEKAKILTYGQLTEQVNKFANGLKELGVKKGDRVGIYLPMIPETAISMLACARIGAVHSVVFSAFSFSALKVRLEDSGAKILITSDGYYRRGKICPLKKAAEQGVKGTKVKKIIVVKRAGNKIPWQKGRDIWWHDLIKKQSPECQPRPMDSEDLLFLLASSGSTGRPKLIIHTCGGYAVQAKWTGQWVFDWRPGDVFWCTADVGWITGHTYGIYSPLLNGIASLIFEGAPDWPKPDRWCRIIEKHGVTVFYTAPTAVRMFEKYGKEWLKKHNFKKLRLLGSVGEPIDEASWQWFFKEVGKRRCPIVDTWWQTETGGILISSLPGIGPFKPAFCGLPFPGVKAVVLDSRGKLLPPGKQGGLAILPPFAPGLTRGIYKNEKRYLETYWQEFGKKIYFSSDGALRDKNGLIRIVGRLDDVIKISGYRFTTGELENIISLLPDVVECAVVPKKDELKGETPVVFAVCAETKKSSDEIKNDIINQVRALSGPIAAPKEIYLVPDLPKTRSGKIMRRILKRLFSKEPLGDLSTLANPEIVERIKKIIYV